MSEETNKINRYESILDSPVQKEFESLKEEYKAARKNCKTIAERETVMEAYKADLMDIGCEAQILQDWRLLSQINGIIKSIELRTARRSFRRF